MLDVSARRNFAGLNLPTLFHRQDPTGDRRARQGQFERKMCFRFSPSSTRPRLRPDLPERNHIPSFPKGSRLE
jgi:hypothetical protein